MCLMAKINLAEYGLSVADTERRKTWVKLLIYIGLAAGTFAAYEPIRKNTFVNYDDHAYITKNANVTGGITLHSVVWSFTKYYAGNWHPLTWLSHILDCQLFGLNPIGHHLVSLLLHIVNALLIFWIFNSVTGAIWPSAFVAAVFAMHPLQVESVAWAAERKTVLSGLFWFLTIAVYIWYTKRPGIGRYLLLFGMYALCIMTKPIVVTLPLVLLLLDYWPLGRVKWEWHTGRVPKNKGLQEVSVWRLITEKIPLFAMSAALSVITFVIQQHSGAVAAMRTIPLDFRFANMFISYIRYIGKIIWPSQLAAFYPYPRANLSDANVAVCMLIFILISLFSIYLGRRRKYIVMGWLWYVGTLVPMIGLVQVGMQSMADRYMYVSILGPLFIAVWTVRDFVFNRPRWKVAVSLLAVVVLFSSVIVTRTQVRYWQNTITLFEHALKVTKNNDLAEKGYGGGLFEAGRFDEAAVHLNNALRIQPGYFAAGNDLGKVYIKQGKLDEAVACFNELLKRKKDSAELYYNLGLALTLQNKYEEAVKCFAGALELDAKYPDAHNRMGTALLATGKNVEAIKYLTEALRISSNDAGLYEKLGNAYAQSGRYEQAIQNWTKTAELKPDSANVLNNLAWLLATANNTFVQDANKAIELAHHACELTDYNEPSYMDTLAVAYAAAGRFKDAVMTAQQAVDTAKSSGQEKLAGEIQSRLELYQAGRPYRGK